MRVTAKRQAAKRSSAPKAARSAVGHGTRGNIGRRCSARTISGRKSSRPIAEGQRRDGQVVGQAPPRGLLEVEQRRQRARVVVEHVVDEKIAVDDAERDVPRFAPRAACASSGARTATAGQARDARAPRSAPAARDLVEARSGPGAGRDSRRWPGEAGPARRPRRRRARAPARRVRSVRPATHGNSDASSSRQRANARRPRRRAAPASARRARRHARRWPPRAARRPPTCPR